ncbi:hypothetical protein PENTCL1PPCAC_2966 [Pristionchus entomophagus]|uniref:Uncharacterized protein n=1 Tax=Pristionchus entomophagus TaxID=358040 RepID=A0AAV5SBW5_9BILA|nr:hypothetical protein PENTCL1PPCAC_2966 [Pristionchus entomophagus]
MSQCQRSRKICSVESEEKNSNMVIIGVGCGVGALLLLAACAVAFYFFRRAKTAEKKLLTLTEKGTTDRKNTALGVAVESNRAAKEKEVVGNPADGARDASGFAARHDVACGARSQEGHSIHQCH